MQFNERVSQRCRDIAGDLEDFTFILVAGCNSAGAAAKALNILRGIYRIQPNAFDKNLVQSIRESTSPTNTSAVVIDDSDQDFVVGHWYLAGRSAYKVLAVVPSLEINHNGAQATFSSDIRPAMWSKHRDTLNAYKEKLARFQASSQTAESEISRLKTEMDDERIEAHARFRIEAGLPPTEIRQSRKSNRVTHCWRCKGELDNVSNFECVSCGWIVCLCGACGCGFG